ncbi:MAG: YdcF family protein, partial [Bacteroidetes bacterium]
MFYILSKIIGLLINPIIWILTLLLCGLFLKKKQLKRKFYLSSIILILVFSNSFILNEVL